MNELLQEYWILLVVALVIGLLVAWWIFVASRKTTVEREDKGEGKSSARRNQALIDAPPAAAKDIGAAQNLARDTEDEQAAASAASPGPVSAAANSDSIAAATASADAEAGPAPTASGDDLSRIKGVGPKLVALLAEHGVTSFAQIAAWDDAEIDRIDAQLGRFQGRIRRDSWVDQAKMLAADDLAAYEARFGRTQ
ncbi:helix-hairpin-helix domain-containing protein [Aurantiacibacter gilvus]|uniref:Helix-hairpin-helix domain-containing protein n=1 Tax=Aurantiacibacter gilvus TaxID=3139141 RepID=A0ABU9IER3_9SPHN